MKINDSLEDILSKAMIEANNANRARKTIATRHDLNYRESFTRPENWLLTRQIELIHVEGSLSTLLGLYDELKHRTVPRCRRLVLTTQRNEALEMVIEKVSGSVWVNHEAWLKRRQPAERTTEIVCNMALAMGQELVAQYVICDAVVAGGGLQRVILAADTIFTGDAPRTVLSLPADLDVLECLTQATRMAIWKEVGGSAS